jgi:hypothetical protein
MNACNPAFTDVADNAEVLLDDAAAVEVEEPEDALAAGSTEAVATVVDAGVVEVVVEVEEALDELDEALDDAAADGVDEVLLDAVDDVLSGTAGVGGANKRMNNAKLMVSGLLSDTVLGLLMESTVLTVSSGSGLGAHWGVGLFRLSGNRSLVTPSSTL